MRQFIRSQRLVKDLKAGRIVEDRENEHQGLAEENGRNVSSEGRGAESVVSSGEEMLVRSIPSLQGQ